MQQSRLRSLLSSLYGAERCDEILRDLNQIIEKYRNRILPPRANGLNERDAILITYADQVQEPGQLPLATLGAFCSAHLGGIVSGIHILPFYPWSSDDGFSVIDYQAVAPQYGTWDDVRGLGARFRLMFDAVVNHASAESAWFQGFLRDEPDYQDFFIAVQGSPDLSTVVRPRALPLLTTFSGPDGNKKLWTTFSADQIDLNYHNPRVLLQIMDLLLFYASQGAEFIRLDAIAYLWKEAGTPSINLPQTHWIVQLMRAVLDEAAPHVMLITETNVPNLENLSYFGDGRNEAQLVYNFPLPPLVLYAMQSGNARVLGEWASGLRLPAPQVTFLNFLASHDGIGLNPLRGILPDSEIEALARRIEAAGGFISTKTNANGTQSPYEMNVNYFDALNSGQLDMPESVQIDRFVSAHAILLAFQGMPALYFHSLFGSRGWPEGVKQTGKNRTVNRQKLGRAELEGELAEPGSRRAQVFGRLAQFLKVRAEHAAFSPQAAQRILRGPDGILIIVRGEAEAGKAVLCIHSVRGQDQQVQLNSSEAGLEPGKDVRDIITGRQFAGGQQLTFDLAPYETLWVTT